VPGTVQKDNPFFIFLLFSAICPNEAVNICTESHELYIF